MVRIFRIFIPTSVIALLFSELALIFFCYLLAILAVQHEADAVVFLLDDNGLGRIAVVTFCIMTGMYFQDLYWKFRVHSKVLLVQQLCLVVGVSFIIQALLTYFRLQDWSLSKWTMIAGSAFTLVLLPLWRILYETLVLHALGRVRLLFLGSSALNMAIARELLERPELGMEPIGFLADLDVPAAARSGPQLGGVSDLKKVAAEMRPDCIVVGMSERRQQLPVADLLDLRFAGVPVEEAQMVYENTFGRVATGSLRPSQLIFSTELGPRSRQVAVQSVYNFVIALVSAALLLPLMILVAVLIKATSEGPILFRQQRVGRGGVEFTLYKFRSMRLNAEAGTGAVWASPDDPRITPLGRWLRRFRIDEVPQLFNVLAGNMSIVGPRPERPEFVSVLNDAIPYYRQRLCVKPGITGWAQINHKYGDTMEDTGVKLEYDLYYIKNLAFSLDVYIMFQTAKVMLLSRGSQ
jgi:sugar transferase (PEP-CTERM system associated)